MTHATHEQPMSNGIDALISRLKQDGISAGESAADKIVAEARAKAAAHLAEAEAEAKRRVDAAQKEAERLKRGGEEALKVAMRDAVLQLKEEMGNRFAKQVGNTIAKLTADEELLSRMIVAIAGRARDEAGLDSAGDVEIVLPRSVPDPEELRRNPDELHKGPLSRLVLASAADMLREGVAFSTGGDADGGIVARMTEAGVEVDLTDRAVADIVLRHLQPRFRALLEGVVG